MSIFREIPPTAGLPIYLNDILSLFAPVRQSLEDDFKKYLGVSFAKVTYSGTAAFYLILEGLKELSSKRTVIIPAYICPLVPLAIKRAGLKIEICDINKNNFNFDLAALEELCALNDDILAVVPVHLAGIPLEFQELEKVCRDNGIFIIEDCAQSLGALYQGNKVGALGDFSFFSLCRGKGLTIYEGGVIVANKKEYAPIIERAFRKLANDDIFSEMIKVLELFGYWIFYRPALFWFIFRLPQLFWNLQGNQFRANIEYFEINFPLHSVSEFRKKIAHNGILRLDAEIIGQRQRAHYYLENLRKIPGITVVDEPAAGQATFPFVTLIFSESHQKEKALKNFEKSGLGVSQIYELAITGYDYLKEMLPDKIYPNAAYLAERAVTLSTSTFMHEKDLDAVLNIIKKL
ncbi:MAG: DegT/DnrJ/EryC1/StrS family aminotransferase [Candidatus Omnitrophica bacterium]|jgi:dTDP-4-amino-4,6-dideoxygalactose transaminase|nr:DegT/DnrJ/EryC1/StrS family aminotransferase [Candidatus Omnitrophota bacterium]